MPKGDVSTTGEEVDTRARNYCQRLRLRGKDMPKLGVFLITIAAALALGVPAAQPEVLLNDSQPFALVAFVPCANGGAGELVLVEGNLHTLITETVNDNAVSLKIHFQGRRVSGSLPATPTTPPV